MCTVRLTLYKEKVFELIKGLLMMLR